MKIIALAGDAGGARAIAPVIAALRSRGNEIECRAYGPAISIWRAIGLQTEPATHTIGDAERMLLGTSLNADQHELALVAAAARARVRSVSVIDSWVHYRERFIGPDGGLRLPDAIAVIDSAARDEAIASGLPAERLVVTGQPAFDALAALRPAVQATREWVRRSLAVGGDPIVLYASQPLHQLYAEATLGFDDRDVLPAVIHALASVLRTRGRRATLVVKLHPREMGLRYDLPASSDPLLALALASDDRIGPHDLAAASDLVVGMNTILLVEACILGIPALSFQPGLRIVDPLPTNRHGWTAAVRDKAGLAPTLDAELFDPVARARRAATLQAIAPPGGAAERVADVLLSD